jgi:hypothetical protein
VKGSVYLDCKLALGHQVQEIWAVAGVGKRPSLTFTSVTDDDKPIRKTVPVILLLTHSANQEGPWEGQKAAADIGVAQIVAKLAKAHPHVKISAVMSRGKAPALF